MKQIISFLSLFFLTGMLHAQTINHQETLEEVIQQVKKEHVPDTRVEVFDIQLIDLLDRLMLEGKTTSVEAKKALLNAFKALGVEVTDSIILLPDEQLGNAHYGVVTLTEVHLRRRAEHSSEMLTQAVLGTPLTILEGGAWLRVQLPDGYIGYVTRRGVTRMDKEAFQQWQRAPKIIYAAMTGSVYERPELHAPVLSDITTGNLLLLNSTLESFYDVSFPDGRRGFVKRSDAQPLERWLRTPSPSGESVVAYAQRFLGIPYLWGGTSTKGMDCSGFVKVVYFMHNIILPRDASQQCHVGTPIPLDNDYEQLLPGDLLFFGAHDKARGRTSIDHVGIYMGNKKFIHASTLVQVNSLDPRADDYDEYNSKRVMRVSRIIGSEQPQGITTIDQNRLYHSEE